MKVYGYCRVSTEEQARDGNSLAAQERECLMLRAEGLRYREIGVVLGIPTSTVADVVERAVKKLAEKCNV